jgi:hypothetical protein
MNRGLCPINDWSGGQYLRERLNNQFSGEVSIDISQLYGGSYETGKPFTDGKSGALRNS